jgi:hypothetical protein
MAGQTHKPPVQHLAAFFSIDRCARAGAVITTKPPHNAGLAPSWAQSPSGTCDGRLGVARLVIKMARCGLVESMTVASLHTKGTLDAHDNRAPSDFEPIS